MGAIESLVVEDAPEFSHIVCSVLEEAGHQVRAVTSVAAAIAALDHRLPELVVLDLGLPDGDGLDLCRTIRERCDAYVVMLTGRDTEVDKLLGFGLGADDYVTKPFSARELGARIEALLRRPRAAHAGGRPRVFDDLVVDPVARIVTLAGQPVTLTRIEFELLDALSVEPRVVRSRQELLDRVWGPGWHGDDHVVDVHVGNLRKKIDLPGGPSHVRTVRGFGYSMAF